MRLFLLKIGIFLIVTVASLFAIYTQADGATDPFYMRFVSPQQKSMIIGTSRAAQGLKPSVFDTILEDKSSMFNYAFTLGHSPFGPTYLKSIKRKLHPETTEGIFVVTVDPWSLATLKDDVNDEDSFPEKTRFLEKMHWTHMNPNVAYLVNHYDAKNYELLFPKENALFLHNDGWLESSPNNMLNRQDERRARKIKEYTARLSREAISEVRFDYLRKTIQFLQNHGTVYLVRLPVHPEMEHLEKKLSPNFSTKIARLAHVHKVKYYDFMPENANYLYVDGHHLYKDSGAEVSEKIARWVLESKKMPDVE